MASSVVAVHVIGLRKFQAELKMVNVAFPAMLRIANKKAAEIVATEARVRAPVLSGALRSSIKASSGALSASVRAGKGSSVTSIYAPIQEFGWPGHNIAPQPYLYPAIAAKQAEVVDVYAGEVNDLIDSVF